MGTRTRGYLTCDSTIVFHENSPEREICRHAMLDNQSNACFVSDSLAERFDVCKQHVNLHLTTMLDKKVVGSDVIQGLVVRGVNEDCEIKLPSTNTKSSIQASRDLIPRPETVGKWQHLKDIDLPAYDERLEIGLLVGFNCSSALIPKEIKAAKDDDAYTVKSNLGWGVTGAISKRNDQQTSDVNYHHFTYRTHAKEVSPAIVSKMFQYEFTDDLSEDRMSYEDRKFLDTVHKGVMMVDDHFEIPLPFKDEAKLLNNKILAEQRLNGLKKTMMKDERYKMDYIQFMKNIIDKGYAERIDENDASQDGSIWYIPHHGVYHPNKPGKIHIVFDCSAEYQGDSLNEDLLQGPDYTNNFAGVLCNEFIVNSSLITL